MIENWNPANLVVNDEGRIYHLDLSGEDIADLIFLVGDPQRVEAVSRHFDRIDTKRNKREFITHTGWLGGQRLSVMSTGISTANIDIALNELDAAANIDLKRREPLSEFRQLTFVRLGTSGSIDPEVGKDTTVVSEYALGFDALLLMYENLPVIDTEFELLRQDLHRYFHLRGLSYPIYLTKANHDLLQKFRGKYKFGMTATMHGFYGPQARELRLKGRYPQLMDILQSFKSGPIKFTNIEMESSGIYGLSTLLNHRAISFNRIIANRTTGEFSKDLYQSVETMIEEVLTDFVS
ncbi:MAG: phosphorylase [Saprospirales bacterium]|nr:MAG: phosphorylase [Saprospirales bacterium]